MVKSLFPIFIAFLAGWVLHVLYAQYQQNNTKETLTIQMKKANFSDDKDTITHEIIEKIVVKEVIKFVPQTKIVYRTKKSTSDKNSSEQDLFLLSLTKKEFYKAMNYYEEADEEKHPIYQTALLGYFNTEQTKNLSKTIEQMQYFIEIESESKPIVFQLAQLFEKQEEYEKALELIIDLSYIVSYTERSSIHTKMKSISTSYITKLTTSNNFKDLIDFLINQVNVGIIEGFYSFELAKAYVKLKKYLNSIEVLQVLKENETYKERAIELLTFIETKMEELEEYPIQIPLIRRGLHFLVKAYVNSTPVLLMIDTGASNTTIDYNLISHLDVIEKNVRFHTAGGDIYSTLFNAKSFTIGSISLDNFRVDGYLFPTKGDNGLLGMNFLGKFKFKIDQKEAILFLGKKY
jgi:clan AA aspartic protease (TIGR02281 family)